jgi:hypothetical protein
MVDDAVPMGCAKPFDIKGLDSWALGGLALACSL